MQMTRDPRFSLIGLLLVIVLVMQGELLILARGPKPGRFVPVARNPYSLLDTANGTECLRVPKSRAGEMLNWLLYSEKDEDVQDSYSAAIAGYTGLQKYYKDEYQRDHPGPQPASGGNKNDPVLQEILAIEAAGPTAAVAEAAASEKTKTEFNYLRRLLNSFDSIPACSKR